MHSVVFVIESMEGGGAQSVLASLANAWALQGRRVNLITFKPEPTDAFALHQSVRRIIIGGTGVSASFLAAIIANALRIFRLRRAIKASGAEVAIAMVGSTNILTILAAAGLGRKIVASERNDPQRQSLGIAWNILRRLVYRHADLVVANSRQASRVLQSYVPKDRVRWLPNPLRRNAPPPDVTGDFPVILSVGRLHAQKGFDVLIDAFRSFSSTFPEWRLLILGEGAERARLEALIDERNLRGKVLLPGYEPNPFSWYRAAQIFVLPSRYEGLPNAVLEAMDNGLPCIVTDSQAGLFDYLVHDVSGLVVPSESCEALSGAMRKLATDGELRARLGHNARLAVQHLTIEQVARAWATMIDEL